MRWECVQSKTDNRKIFNTNSKAHGLDQKGNRKPGMVSEIYRHTLTNGMLAEFITDPLSHLIIANCVTLYYKNSEFHIVKNTV